ncbi:MAG: AAA family ATPase, partial [Flavobacteriales bacterium]|nr:AAA family ATPase [Flavobacteriales bacterium]
MAKVRTQYVCQQCGARHAQWLGQCGQCKAWNTLVEELVDRAEERRGTPAGLRSKTPRPVAIGAIAAEEGPRVRLGDAELDRVLGGGLVPGSIVLIGGEPGIGKSTLLLQTALRAPGVRTLYVSGEESEHQIKLRADRLPTSAEGGNCFVLTETNTQNLFKQVEELEPGLLVIDSIQTLHSAVLDASPGSVGQVRECTAELLRLAKSTGIPVVLIGHITKEGYLAGPKV